MHYALPDIYVHTTPKSRRIRQCTSACVATNMLHFRHSTYLTELAIECFDYLQNNSKSLWLWYFNSDVSVTFIYIIDTTGFEYGILLNASEEMFHRFYQKVALDDRVKPIMQG